MKDTLKIFSLILILIMCGLTIYILTRNKSVNFPDPTFKVLKDKPVDTEPIEYWPVTGDVKG